jgi:hypothetical protein
MSPLYERAGAPVDRSLPPDERQTAAALILRAGGALTSAERALCVAATRPGAEPLDWRARLRLSETAGRILGSAAP